VIAGHTRGRTHVWNQAAAGSGQEKKPGQYHASKRAAEHCDLKMRIAWSGHECVHSKQGSANRANEKQP